MSDIIFGIYSLHRLKRLAYAIACTICHCHSGKRIKYLASVLADECGVDVRKLLQVVAVVHAAAFHEKLET